MCRLQSIGVVLTVFSVWVPNSFAAEEPAPPRVLDFAITNSQRRVRFTPYPAAQEFQILQAPAVQAPFTEDTSGKFSGYQWLAPATSASPAGFYRMRVTPLSDRLLWTATVLQRLAYGPTPDDLERLETIGPQAYLEEQIAPENISESLDLDQAAPAGDWQYIVASGTGSTSTLYVYLNLPGEGYIDDLKLVAGSVPEAGTNLLRNGDFEGPLSTNDWTISTNLTASALATAVKHLGNSSLRLVASSAGSTKESAIWQEVKPALSSTKTYTLSYWYLPAGTKVTSPTVRLSGSGVVGQLSLATRLATGTASIADLQSWFVMHAVQSRRQLLEVLTQFVDNHFTTLYTKSRDYIDGLVKSETAAVVATEFEYRELKKWRAVVLNPNGTFYDLLKISAESPAMVIYLDTVTSSKGAANENYSRELMELFTMGVDNGYDQKDIEEMARAWTGWRVDKLPLGQENNPLATAVTNKDNDPGYWTIRLSRSNHDTNSKSLFTGKTIEARFGPPHAGASYELKLPARVDTQGMKDGYDILAHLADLPYTQEYISVKLCRLLVHENFFHGVYDYTASDLSAEAKLIRQCLAAWDAPAADGRKGNLRAVLRTILESTLFRQHAASRQKVKTPFEFTVSAVRALRAVKPDGGFTADSTGADLIDDMQKMGMNLFHREEPDGWSELGRDWINTSSLVDRMRFLQGFLKVGNTRYSDPVGLLKLKMPASQWRDPAAVADYFLDLLFLGEGRANLTLDRAAAIAFMNTNEAGTLASSFSSLDPNSAGYDTRVRGLVALLLGLPRFHEQ